MFAKRCRKFGLWALLLLTFASSKASVAQVVLYDNLNSKRIDPAKWDGFFLDSDSRDAVREISPTPGKDDGRSLRLKESTYSVTTDDNGATGTIFGLSFPVPDAITETSFTVLVKDVKVCEQPIRPGGHRSRVSRALFQHGKFADQPTGRRGGRYWRLSQFD